MPKDKSQQFRHRDPDVECPFFLGHTKTVLKCEGFDPHCTQEFHFEATSSNGVSAYLDRRVSDYCAAQYKRCHHYKALMEEKYGKEWNR